MSNNEVNYKSNILQIDYSNPLQTINVVSDSYKKLFNWKQYTKYYSDLNGKTLDSAWNHWVNHGFKEKRIFFLNKEYNNGIAKKETNVNNEENNNIQLKKEASNKNILEYAHLNNSLIKKNNLIHKNFYGNYGTHYSGWKEAMNAFVKQLDNDVLKEPIFFDEWLEKFLIWGNKVEKKYYLKEIHANNYKIITFVHNPPFKKWHENDYKNIIKNKIIYHDEHTNRTLIKMINKYNLDSKIVFLYTLTIEHKEYLYKKCPQFRKKLMSINHPIDIRSDDKRFDFSLFCKNKQIIHIGWWLRNFETFIKFKQPKDFHKSILIKKDFETGWNTLSSSYNLDKISIIKELNDSEYENLFTNSCVFIHLEDACATNTIIECIKFNTPIITNKIKSVTEYLGEDYPLYFQTEDDLLLFNNSNYLSFKIHEAHEYLSKMDKNFLLPETFNNKINYDLTKLRVANTQLTWFTLIDTFSNIDKQIIHLYNNFVGQIDNSRLKLHIVICESLMTDINYENVIERISQYSETISNFCFSIKMIGDKYNEFLNYCLEICDTDYIVIVDTFDDHNPNYSQHVMNYLDTTPTCDATFSSYKIISDNGYAENFIFEQDLMLFCNNFCTIMLPNSGIVWRKDINKINGNFTYLKNKTFIFRDFLLRMLKNNFNIMCCKSDFLYKNTVK